MARIRVFFGHQIMLNYGDPQPMALGGRLVAVAEIAPDLLISIRAFPASLSQRDLKEGRRDIMGRMRPRLMKK
jgi:hypothetical protein